MKKKSLVMTMCVALALVLGLGGVALADTPNVNITSPVSGATVYVTTFPYTISISFTLAHSQLKNLTNLAVQVGGTDLFTPVNPFKNAPAAQENQPTDDLLAITGAGGVTVSDSDHATVTVPWTVASPGDYTIAVLTQHRSDVGLDEETVTISSVAVEYPAPPAVANAYINANYKSIAGKKRGTIISVIAENQAKSEKYGPRGGPYDEDLIKADVDSYVSSLP